MFFFFFSFSFLLFLVRFPVDADFLSVPLLLSFNLYLSISPTFSPTLFHPFLANWCKIQKWERNRSLMVVIHKNLWKDQVNLSHWMQHITFNENCWGNHLNISNSTIHFILCSEKWKRYICTILFIEREVYLFLSVSNCDAPKNE